MWSTIARKKLFESKISSEVEESKYDSFTVSRVSSFHESDFHDGSDQWHTPYETSASKSVGQDTLGYMTPMDDVDEDIDMDEA